MFMLLLMLMLISNVVTYLFSSAPLNTQLTTSMNATAIGSARSAGGVILTMVAEDTGGPVLLADTWVEHEVELTLRLHYDPVPMPRSYHDRIGPNLSKSDHFRGGFTVIRRNRPQWSHLSRYIFPCPHRLN